MSTIIGVYTFFGFRPGIGFSVISGEGRSGDEVSVSTELRGEGEEEREYRPSSAAVVTPIHIYNNIW